MPSTIKMPTAFFAAQQPALDKSTKINNQSRRFFLLAAVLGGMNAMENNGDICTQAGCPTASSTITTSSSKPRAWHARGSQMRPTR